MSQYGTLVLFCGKMGAGKSTMAQQVKEERSAVLISEDEWLSKLYPNEITSFEDYIQYSSRLKPIVKTLVQNILDVGTTVVLDFPGNTVRQRAWLKQIFQDTPYEHKLIYLQADDEVCLERLKARQHLQPERAHFDTPEVFKQVTAYFEAPSPNEGFTIETITQLKD